MEGVVPVGVVGLLEKPEPAEGKDRDYDGRDGGKNNKDAVHVLHVLPPRLPPRLPRSANGSRVFGLVWWVGVL